MAHAGMMRAMAALLHTSSGKGRPERKKDGRGEAAAWGNGLSRDLSLLGRDAGKINVDAHTMFARAAMDGVSPTTVAGVGLKCSSLVRMTGCGVVVHNRRAAVSASVLRPAQAM